MSKRDDIIYSEACECYANKFYSPAITLDKYLMLGLLPITSVALGTVKGLPFLPQVSLWLLKLSLFWQQKDPGKRLRAYPQVNIIKKKPR